MRKYADVRTSKEQLNMYMNRTWSQLGFIFHKGMVYNFVKLSFLNVLLDLSTKVLSPFL